MYCEHLLSIGHVQRLLYHQVDGPNGSHALRALPFFTNQDGVGQCPCDTHVLDTGFFSLSYQGDGSPYVHATLTRLLVTLLIFRGGMTTSRLTGMFCFCFLFIL